MSDRIIIDNIAAMKAAQFRPVKNLRTISPKRSCNSCKYMQAWEKVGWEHVYQCQREGGPEFNMDDMDDVYKIELTVCDRYRSVA